jgi:ferric-dicitrate binding protein FerR (iron transport regulator)
MPRPAGDPENLRRLQEEAKRRLDRELAPTPRPVYGGPPRPTRRWAVRGLVIAAAALVAAILAWFMGRRSIAPVAVYGGPPSREPRP